MSLGRNPQGGGTAGPGRYCGRIIVLAALLAALSCGAVPVSAVPVSGAAVAGRGAAAVPSVVLCSGYRGCDRAGYDSYGYGQHGRSSYWRMAAGNECTNYVAYVEARYFRVATPGCRLGNAYQSPAAAAAHGVTVSKVPSVGSVASGTAAPTASARTATSPSSSESARGTGTSWSRSSTCVALRTATSGPGSMPDSRPGPGSPGPASSFTSGSAGPVVAGTGTTAGTDTGGPAERTQPCHTNALVRTSPPAAGSAGPCAARQW
jgi:hypothetical protein